MRPIRDQVAAEEETQALFRARNPHWKAPRFEDPFEAVAAIARSVRLLIISEPARMEQAA